MVVSNVPLPPGRAVSPVAALCHTPHLLLVSRPSFLHPCPAVRTYIAPVRCPACSIAEYRGIYGIMGEKARQDKDVTQWK